MLCHCFSSVTLPVPAPITYVQPLMGRVCTTMSTSSVSTLYLVL